MGGKNTSSNTIYIYAHLVKLTSRIWSVFHKATDTLFLSVSVVLY